MSARSSRLKTCRRGLVHSRVEKYISMMDVQLANGYFKPLDAADIEAAKKNRNPIPVFPPPRD
jgi:hypothetical protein